MSDASVEGAPVRFSLVMCTRGRDVEVEAFLESLQAQDRRDFELIVVDQNDDDRLVPAMDRFSGRFRLRYLRMGGSGAARARNLGLAHVSGELVGFPDDDCCYLPGYLDAVDRAFIENPALGGLTGQPTAEKLQHDEQSLTEWHSIGIYTVHNLSQEFTIWIRRERLGTLRYNERMGVGARTLWGADEGPDLLIRLMQTGCTMRYYPRLFVYHPNKIMSVSRATLSRAASYARGRGCLFRLHRFPARLMVTALFRPAAGCGVCLATVRPLRSAYYFAVFAGMLRGLLMSRSELAEVEQGSVLTTTAVEVSR